MLREYERTMSQVRKKNLLNADIAKHGIPGSSAYSNTQSFGRPGFLAMSDSKRNSLAKVNKPTFNDLIREKRLLRS